MLNVIIQLFKLVQTADTTLLDSREPGLNRQTDTDFLKGVWTKGIA